MKLAVLGAGAGMAVTRLGGTTAMSSEPVARDYISTGVLVTRQRGGTVSSAAERAVYSFDMSATYDLSGQQIAFRTVRLTGNPACGGLARTIVVSKKSDLLGTLNGSGCFNIVGGANVSDGVAGFYSAKIRLDGCVVSNAVPLIRGTVFRAASTDPTAVASTVISIS